MATLSLRFRGEPVQTEFVSFAMASELLGIPYPFTRMTRGYFGPTNEPQVHMRWLEENIPWTMELNDVDLRQFFFYFCQSSTPKSKKKNQLQASGRKI